MTTWHALEDELGHWGEAGRTATFWWRDDDAGRAVPALARMIELRRDLDVGLAVAVVPSWLEPEAVDLIAGDPGTTVLQHGIAHANHAAPHEKKCELVASIPRARLLTGLGDGAARLRESFGAQALAVLVPPWNRIAASVGEGLGGAGFVGLSRFGPRASRGGPGGTIQVNSHVDVIAWHHGRGFIGDTAALAVAIGHLKSRRDGAVDRAEPTGLLTHHLVHDAACWRFVARFIAATRRSPTVRWLSAREAFAGAAP